MQKAKRNWQGRLGQNYNLASSSDPEKFLQPAARLDHSYFAAGFRLTPSGRLFDSNRGSPFCDFFLRFAIKSQTGNASVGVSLGGLSWGITPCIFKIDKREDSDRARPNIE